MHNSSSNQANNRLILTVYLLFILFLALLLVLNSYSVESSIGSKDIDRLIRKKWDENNLKPSEQTSDEEFMRRLYLDASGRIPTAEEVKGFLNDDSPEKRTNKINELLNSDEFGQNMADVWISLLFTQDNRKRVPPFKYQYRDMKKNLDNRLLQGRGLLRRSAPRKSSEFFCGCRDHKEGKELSRRTFLSISMALASGLIFSKFGFTKNLKNTNPNFSFMNPMNTQAEAVIVLWMSGGPSQFETFSPKPSSKNGGSIKSIQTRVPGIEISEYLPNLAEQMDKISLIRTLSSKEGNHDRARYLMHTSYPPVGVVKHPSFGAISAKELGGAKEFDLPFFISINGPSYSAEFLGKEYSPYVIKDVNKPLQNINKFGSVDDTRFKQRLELLNNSEDDFYKEKGLDDINSHKLVYDKTVKMMNSPLIKTFDISEETEALKQAYGNSNFGKACLMARRLIEAGVKFVEVTLDGWDTHQNNFTRTSTLCQTLDPAFATLIKDLNERRLLEKTLVLCLGEFGRTPKINTNDGRDHFPDAFACALAGGGIKAGQVIGATNDDGNEIVSKPVLPENLFATLCYQLGIDYNKINYSPQGRPLKYVNNGSVIEELV